MRGPGSISLPTSNSAHASARRKRATSTTTGDVILRQASALGRPQAWLLPAERSARTLVSYWPLARSCFFIEWLATDLPHSRRRRRGTTRHPQPKHLRDSYLQLQVPGKRKAGPRAGGLGNLLGRRCAARRAQSAAAPRARDAGVARKGSSLLKSSCFTMSGVVDCWTKGPGVQVLDMFVCSLTFSRGVGRSQSNGLRSGCFTGLPRHGEPPECGSCRALAIGVRRRLPHVSRDAGRGRGITQSNRRGTRRGKGYFSPPNQWLALPKFGRTCSSPDKKRI